MFTVSQALTLRNLIIVSLLSSTTFAEDVLYSRRHGLAKRGLDADGNYNICEDLANCSESCSLTKDSILSPQRRSCSLGRIQFFWD